MRLTWLVRIFLILVMVMARARAAGCCQDSVAVIESLTGEVSVRAPGAKSRAVVSRLDWLAAGSLIEVGSKSRATVILLNGHHYELGQGAKATVTGDSLAAPTGPIRQLKPLPPIPKAVPIAGSPSQIAGAARLRGAAKIRALYPANGAAAQPAQVSLSFAGIPDASIYRVDLEDQDENALMTLSTESTDIVIPVGTLKAGRLYFWRVQALDKAAVIAEGAAAFMTISGEDIERRAEFSRATQGAADKASALALLADIDFRLGLLKEARDGFIAALRLKPGEIAVQHALDLVQSALASEPEK